MEARLRSRATGSDFQDVGLSAVTLRYQEYRVCMYIYMF